jgi:uncharacterized Zn finger protein
MPKTWRPFDYDCSHCGGAAEVLTDSDDDDWAYDGDIARCSECGCQGQVVVDEADDINVARVEWHHDEQPQYRQRSLLS